MRRGYPPRRMPTRNSHSQFPLAIPTCLHKSITESKLRPVVGAVIGVIDDDPEVDGNRLGFALTPYDADNLNQPPGMVNQPDAPIRVFFHNVPQLPFPSSLNPRPAS
jgi:hypothetical protein